MSSSSSSSTTVGSPPHPVPYYLINQHAHFLTRDNQDEWQFALSFAVRFVVYVALIVVIMIVVSVMMKLMKDCDDIGEVTATETNPLIPKEEETTTSLTYGTCDEQDLESGNGNGNGSCSWSEDLYDAKICVICYDHSRDCFFVPCGHCATCYACAQRMIDGEIKNCPICRRLIHKVRKLFTSYQYKKEGR